MAALLVSRDLWFTSQVSGGAARVQVEVRTVADVASIEPQSSSVTLAIVDLNTPNLAVDDCVARLREASPGVHIVACGPHVRRERLQAARDAGCDQVLSQGQFHANVAELLANYGSRQS